MDPKSLSPDPAAPGREPSAVRADPERQPDPFPPRSAPTRRRWRIAGIAAALSGALALGACSHGGHPGWGRGGFSGAVDPERAAQLAERMADRIVSKVDGTPEQRQKISAIAQAAAKDLLPAREQARQARQRSIELLKAPTIDRGAIESLRAEQVRLADGASRRLAQALADVAEVLTPQQRARLAERMESRRRWGWS